MPTLLLCLALAAPPDALPRAEPSTHPNRALLGTGAVLGYISYGTALAVPVVYGALVVPFLAAAKTSVPTEPFLLFLPVASPILLGHTNALDKEAGLRAVLYVDAGVQALALALILAGVAVREPDLPSALRPAPFPGGVGLARHF
jgi:hypothetical protein